MDEQTDTEQAHATLRDTVIAAGPVENEFRMTEAEPVQLHEVYRAEPLTARETDFRPVEGTAVAEPTARLQPMEGTVAPEPFSRLQPLEEAHLAEPTARLQPMERTDAAPLARALPVQSTAPAAAAADAKRLAPTQAAASQAGGSAGSGFQVDPDQYRAAVSPVLAAADQLSQLVTGLTAYLDHTQSTAPWGNDESGKKFAEGEKGYLKYSTDTLKGLKGMPDAVRYIADGLKAMAENYQATEEGTTSVFQDDGGSGAVSVPQTGSYAAPVDVMTPLAPRVGTTVHPSTNRRA
jgi:hypothetical protein